MTVGEKIRQLRESIGYSQNKLAEWAGISQTHLRRVERGEADITVGHLQLLCDALGLTLGEFFADGEDGAGKENPLGSLSPRQKQLLFDFLKSL